MKYVLMVAYQVYPMNSPGAVRPGKFAKYLPEYGWGPVILTGKLDKTDQNGIIRKRGIIHIERIHAAKPSFRGATRLSRWLPLFMFESLWYKRAVASGLKMLRSFGCSVIWSTALPPVCHMVGYTLSRRTGLPLVLDYRDLWSLNPYSQPKLSISRRLDRKFEQQVLDQASAVITISDRMGAQLLELGLNKSKLHIIPNGFDPSDFAGKQIQPIPNTFAHIGSIYGERIPTTLGFFKALSRFERQAPGEARQLTFHFIGKVDKSLKLAAQSMLSHIQIVFTDRISHDKAILAMREAGVLVLINETAEMESVTSKVFEYLGSGRPILAIGQSEAVSQLVGGLDDCRYISDVNNHQAIVNAMNDLLNLNASRPITLTPTKRTHILERYNRRSLTGRLAELLDMVTIDR